MALASRASVSNSFIGHKQASRSVRPALCRGRHAIVVRASQVFNVSRRDAVTAGGAVLLAGLLNVSPAQAFLGFGEGAQRAEAYKSDTSAILGKVNSVLALDKDDPAKEDRVKELRKDINVWVAKYRRDDTFAGRPSFGNTYSALNALAGHYNSFGATAPIPKKRLDRLSKELGDAELLLTRDR